MPRSRQEDCRDDDGTCSDSWHMPEVCTSVNCRSACLKETGETMDVASGRGSAAYGRAAAFVARSLVRNFSDWKRSVKARHPQVVFAIGGASGRDAGGLPHRLQRWTRSCM